MASSPLIKCICNGTHSGEICPNCGMPKTTALYMGRTAPLLPVIILACMGGVFAFQHYNAEGYIADIVDKTKAEIETVVQKTTSESEPLPEQSGTLTVQPTGTPRTSTSLIERDTEGVVPPHTGNTPEVSTDDTPEVFTDYKRHSVLKTIPTDDPTLVKTIQASLRSGYVKGDKVIRPEKVAVYVINSQP